MLLIHPQPSPAPPSPTQLQEENQRPHLTSRQVTWSQISGVGLNPKLHYHAAGYWVFLVSLWSGQPSLNVTIVRPSNTLILRTRSVTNSYFFYCIAVVSSGGNSRTEEVPLSPFFHPGQTSPTSTELPALSPDATTQSSLSQHPREPQPSTGVGTQGKPNSHHQSHVGNHDRSCHADRNHFSRPACGTSSDTSLSPAQSSSVAPHYLSAGDTTICSSAVRCSRSSTVWPHRPSQACLHNPPTSELLKHFCFKTLSSNGILDKIPAY